MAKGNVEIVVAKGRTIYSGSHKDSRPRFVAAGEKLSIPAEDAEWLKAQGFIHSDDAHQVESGPGPRFGSDEGPQIKGVAA